jgi:hypothetical protein
MLSFLQRFGHMVLGVLSGFDRLRLRGSKRLLSGVPGLLSFLRQRGIPLRDFGDYAEQTTQLVRRAVLEDARRQGRPVVHLPSAAINKEERARQLAAADGVREGLIGVFKRQEACRSFAVRRDPHTGEPRLRAEPRKCLYFYHYYLDPELGFLHARLQTWFPFTVHVCLNGREWLARQMDAAGLGYVRRGNCFTQLADPERAQALADAQLRADWPALLGRIAARSNPAHDQVFALPRPVPYYWSVDESEWATDLMFRSAADLARLSGRLLRHGLTALGSADVLRFLGKKLTAAGAINGNFTGEVTGELKGRPEGVRVKHRLNRNWVKMYDKQGSVLRVETVINDPRDLKAYRAKEGDEGGPKQWRRLRKGVADLHRRAEVSQKANERYVEALATVEGSATLGELAEAPCRPVRWHGRRVRGLSPLGEADARLLGAVGRGEFVVNGFRNRDLRPLLFEGAANSAAEARRRSAAVTRRLRRLRAHGLIQKVAKTHRHVVTEQGRALITAVLAARQASTAKLGEAA